MQQHEKSLKKFVDDFLDVYHYKKSWAMPDIENSDFLRFSAKLTP